MPGSDQPDTLEDCHKFHNHQSPQAVNRCLACPRVQANVTSSLPLQTLEVNAEVEPPESDHFSREHGLPWHTPATPHPVDVVASDHARDTLSRRTRYLRSPASTALRRRRRRRRRRKIYSHQPDPPPPSIATGIPEREPISGAKSFPKIVGILQGLGSTQTSTTTKIALPYVAKQLRLGPPGLAAFAVVACEQ